MLKKFCAGAILIAALGLAPLFIEKADAVFSFQNKASGAAMSTGQGVDVNEPFIMLLTGIGLLGVAGFARTNRRT
jgi:hypothetical protein